MALLGALPGFSRLLLFLLAISTLEQSSAFRTAQGARVGLEGPGRQQHLEQPGGARSDGQPLLSSSGWLPISLLQSIQAQAQSVRASQFHPDEIVAYFLTSVAAALVFWTYGPLGARAGERREQVRSELAELEQTFSVSLGELEELLRSTEESGALSAERNSEGKLRSFRRLLHNLRQEVSEDPGRAPGSEPQGGQLLQPLRALSLHWLRVFGLCALRPETESLHIASEDELAACADVPALATMLCRRLDDCDLSVLRGSTKKAEALLKSKPLPANTPALTEKPRQRSCTWFHFSPGCRLGFGCSSSGAEGAVYPIEVRLGLCSATLLSSLHTFTVSGFIKCLTLMAVEACLGKLAFVALLLAAAGGFILASMRTELMDPYSASEAKLACLREKSEEVAEVRTAISSFLGHRQEISELWQLHIEPRLEHLEELADRLGDAPKGVLLELFEACNSCLDDVERCMGSIGTWVGPEACAWQARDLGCRQLRAHTDALAAAHAEGSADGRILDILRQPIFGLVVVRVRAASGLRAADFTAVSGRSDPYVACKVGEQETRTYCVENAMDPIWDSEPFVFELCSGDLELELNVLDADSCNRRDCLGQIVLDVRDLPRGSWQERKASLQPSRSVPEPTSRGSTPRGSTPRGSTPRSSTPRGSAPEAAQTTPPRSSLMRRLTPRSFQRGSLEAGSPARVVRGELHFDVYYADTVGEMAWGGAELP